MKQKPFQVRGRFFVKVPLDGGASFSIESDKDKSLEAPRIVECLREYADFIERHFVRRAEDERTGS